MGILNVTPDSFSDGGQFYDPNKAVEKALALWDEGADLVDIGGESTRPGAKPVSTEEEWARISPVLEALAKRPSVDLRKISIDSRNPVVVNRVLEQGVGFINVVGGLIPGINYEAMARYKTSYIGVHMHGQPQTMQANPLNGKSARRELGLFSHQLFSELKERGLAADQIYLDPGIGFGKTTAANLSLLSNLREWTKDHRICVGISRKRFIGEIWDKSAPSDRDDLSKAFEFGLLMAGVAIIRTHNVPQLAKLLKLAGEDYV